MTISPFIKIGALGLVGGLALGLAACSSSTDATGSSDGNTKTVAFVAAQMTSTYFQTMQCGAKTAAEENGLDLYWQGDADWNLQTQIPLINAAVQTQPDGFVLVPTDPVALVQTVQDIAADGTPVFTVDGNLDEPVETQNIATDNIAAGALAAEQLGEAIGGSGTVLVIANSPGIVVNGQRVTGFVEKMKESYPNIKVLDTQYAGADQAEASQIAAAALTDPDVKGVYATLEPAAAGAASAIQAAGRTGEVKLVAYDASPTQVEDLRNGVVDALVAQDPYSLGYDSVTRIAQILDGDVDAADIDHNATTRAFVITRDNVDSDEAKEFLYTNGC